MTHPGAARRVSAAAGVTSGSTLSIVERHLADRVTPKIEPQLKGLILHSYLRARP